MFLFSILNYHGFGPTQTLALYFTPEFSIVILIILAALTFAAVSIFKKRKSFSTKHGCDHDCGCGK